jgi:type II secretory pathway pseudopilin PulG
MSVLARANRGLREQAGHTLVELLAALALTSIVMTATLAGLDVFATTARTTELQTESRTRARLAVEALTRNLRNVASPQADNRHGLETAEATQLVFTEPAERTDGAPPTGGRRVRYCLDASTPASGRLWRQTQTWAAGATPLAPSTSACPDAAWGDRQLVADRLTNAIRTPPAPVWSFDADAPSEIGMIRTELYVDVEPTQAPPAARLATGVMLRNQNRPPSAEFSATVSGSSHVFLNASAARDPEGGVLEYVWYRDGREIGKGLTLDHATPGPGIYVFTLRVYDAEGFSGVSTSRRVTIS